jgi:glyoxylase-like metal-dependent hydrolase (beta-lactamase superfamily II)
MFTNKPGKIADGLYLLGEQLCLFYLVRGKESMIIGGGMNWVVHKLEEQLQEFGVSADEIKYLVIPHPHFDHCGAVPYLKRKYPQMKVLATEASMAILSKQKVIDYIEAANLFMIDHFGARDQYEKLNLKIDSIVINQTISDSSIIDLGNGLDVHFLDTPGHSPGDISVYIPGLKAIFPSDAVPCPLGLIDKMALPSPQYDFRLFKESLRKLATCDVEICGFDHNVAVLGQDAKKVLLSALQMSEEYGKRIIDIYEGKKDFEQTVRWVVHERLEVDGFAFLNEDLMMPVARAEVRNILKASGINVS